MTYREWPKVNTKMWFFVDPIDTTKAVLWFCDSVYLKIKETATDGKEN